MADVCGLTDIGFSGRSWTFEKKVSSGSYCRVRLDRALVSGDWYLRFPLAAVQHLVVAASDHGFILLTWRRADNVQKKCHCFRYEVMWEAHEAFTPSLAKSWQKYRATVRVKELQLKLKGVANHLGNWERQTFGQVRRELKYLKKELERMQADPSRLGPSQA
jgi:hypothetical protein